MDKLNNEDLLEYWDGTRDTDPYEEVDYLGVVETWRWGTVEAKVYKEKATDKYFQMRATFQTEEGIVEPLEIHEVTPQEKTITEWVAVK